MPNNSTWLDSDAHCIVSDASVFAADNLSGFAWAIYEHGKLIRRGEKFHGCHRSVRVEIAGYLAVLRKIPRDGKKIHLLYDIDCLPMMLASKVSYQESLEPEISLLKKEAEGRDLRLFRVKQELAHHDCHNRARNFLRQRLQGDDHLQAGAVYWALRGNRHAEEHQPGCLRWLKVHCYRGPGQHPLPRGRKRQEILRFQLIDDDPHPAPHDKGIHKKEDACWHFKHAHAPSPLQTPGNLPFPLMHGKRRQLIPPAEARAYLKAHYLCNAAWKTLQETQILLENQTRAIAEKMPAAE